ncbi:MAG: DUF805 domain-containing protein [Lachnospiraceae bacterium]|nr:DUF805 domain-containing protein [Lachnospiraceae bacterium]
MDLVNYYVGCLKNYAKFDGRARRKEYWMFVLGNFIIGFVLGFILGIIGAPTYIGYIYSLAVLVPSIAVAVRRLHDIGKSGVWYFINFIPCIGSIWLIVLLCQDSMPGENEYGVNPKEVVDANYI